MNPVSTDGIGLQIGATDIVPSRCFIKIIVLAADPRSRRTQASVRRRGDCALIILRTHAPNAVTQVATDIVLVAGLVCR